MAATVDFLKALDEHCNTQANRRSSASRIVPSSRNSLVSLWYILLNAILRISVAAGAPITGHVNSENATVFSSFAIGTQDLAALVGFFTTDSVERHMVDFYKGRVCAAASTLSLLGMLGWTRGMFKLAIGPKNCEKVGFPTTLLRTMNGVSDSERLATENITEVRYVRSCRTAENVVWSLHDTKLHTPESFPAPSILKSLLQRGLMHLRSERRHTPLFAVRVDSRYHSHSFWRGLKDHLNLETRIGFWLWRFLNSLQYSRSKTVKVFRRCFKKPFLFIGTCAERLLFLISIGISTGLSTFAIWPLTSGTHWSRYVASAGLSICVVGASCIWQYLFKKACIQKQDFFESDGTLPYRWNQPPRGFGLFKIGSSRVFFPCEAIYGRQLFFFRTLTAFFALGSVVGYICQYLQVRTMSAQHSGIWLGFQGALALTRIAIWLIYPHLSKFSFVQDTHYRLETMPPIEIEEIVHSSDLVSRKDPEIWNSSIEAEFITSWFDPYYVPPLPEYNFRDEVPNHADNPLIIPTWVLTHLGKKRLDFRKALEPFYRARRGEREPLIRACFESERFWDLPGELFLNWLLLRNTHESYESLVQRNILPGLPVSFMRGSKWGCRIIEVNERIYLWPCIRYCSAVYDGYHKKGFYALIFCYEGQASLLNLVATETNPNIKIHRPERDKRNYPSGKIDFETMSLGPASLGKQKFFSHDLGFLNVRLTPRYWSENRIATIKPSLDYMLVLLENIVEQIDGPVIEPKDLTDHNSYGISFA